MANRVPLIVDTTTLNIKELPSGDNLDLSNSGIHNAGVITATTFSGSFTGDVTGSASSITVAAETSDTTCSIVFVTAATGALPPKTSTGLTYDSANSNVTIGGSLTVANNISIGGTIQYQDVTNVESLGIITARKGINIGPADAGAYLTGIGASFNHVGDFITVGVSTFQGNIDANGALDVDGQTDLDVLNVSDTATFSGALNANGGIACDTNKFTVADTTGNTTIAGSLDVNGGFKCDTNKFVVADTTGNTTIDGTLDVDGQTDLDVLNVAETATFSALTKIRQGINIGPADAGGYGTGIGATFTHAGDFITVGVSTFQGNIDANGNLDVDGQTDLDVLNVSATATFSSNIDANGALDVDGQTDLDVLNVAETATFSDDVEFKGSAGVTSAFWDKSANLFNFKDHVKATFGSSDDLAIYHDQNNSFISDQGTGELRVLANVFTVKNAADDETMILGGQNGAVTLYNNNNARVGTTTEGADISGPGALKIPVGVTGFRPSSPADGDIRYNSTLNSYEGYGNGAWGGLGGGTEIDHPVAGTTATGIGTFVKTSYRSASFRVQITQGSAYQVGRYLLIHDGTTATVVEESAIATGSMLGDITAAIVSSNVIIYVTMDSSAAATVTSVIDKITV